MKTRKIALLAVLTAAALTIFVLEAQIPPIVPLPGVKLGLANVITLFTLVTLGRRDAFFVMMMRVILGSIFAGSAASFIYSAAGAFVCFGFMSAASAVLKDKAVWLISVIGAIGHNIGQIGAALFMTQTVGVIWYLPVLIISAVITGVFTGLVTQKLVKHSDGLIQKMIKEFN